MATERITEQEVAEEVSQESSFLVMQEVEKDDGSIKESVLRATLKAIVSALRTAGINDGLMLTEDFDSMKDSIIKNITIDKEKITVELLNGEAKEYSTDIFEQSTEVKTDDCLFFALNKEKENGDITTEISKITLADFLIAIKATGFTDDLMTHIEFDKEKKNIIKSVRLDGNNIVVTTLDGKTETYTIDSVYFDSAYVDENNLFHFTKKGVDVVVPVKLPKKNYDEFGISTKFIRPIFLEEFI